MGKIFGIGWAKTGTTTLGSCLKILGCKHQSQRLDLVKDLALGDFRRILALAQINDSFDDWPWLLLYRELDRFFPGSRFILTVREPVSWLKSYRHMLDNQGRASESLNQIRRILYGLPFPNVSDNQLIDRYIKHNEDVLQYFKERQGVLAILDWEKGDGWHELCSFLGKDIPAEAFPHANKGIYRSLESQR